MSDLLMLNAKYCTKTGSVLAQKSILYSAIFIDNFGLYSQFMLIKANCLDCPLLNLNDF